MKKRIKNLIYILVVLFLLQYDVSYLSLVSLLLSLAFTIFVMIPDEDYKKLYREEPLPVYLLTLVFCIAIYWQIILFFFIIVLKILPILFMYIIEKVSSGVNSIFNNVSQFGSGVSNIISNTNEGLIGAIIGGIFSIIGVKISISSSYKKYYENNYESVRPRLLITIYEKNVDKIVGKGSIYVSDSLKSNNKKEKTCDKDNDSSARVNDEFDYVFYVFNNGADAMRIQAVNMLAGHTIWEGRPGQQDIIEFYPVLKAGQGLEIHWTSSLSAINLYKEGSIPTEICLDYRDIYSNPYNQRHHMLVSYYEGESGMHVYLETMPYNIKRYRKKKNFWKTIKRLDIFPSPFIREEYKR